MMWLPGVCPAASLGTALAPIQLSRNLAAVYGNDIPSDAVGLKWRAVRGGKFEGNCLQHFQINIVRGLKAQEGGLYMILLRQNLNVFHGLSILSGGQVTCHQRHQYCGPSLSDVSCTCHDVCSSPPAVGCRCCNAVSQSHAWHEAISVLHVTGAFQMPMMTSRPLQTGYRLRTQKLRLADGHMRDW